MVKHLSNTLFEFYFFIIIILIIKLAFLQRMKFFKFSEIVLHDLRKVILCLYTDSSDV